MKHLYLLSILLLSSLLSIAQSSGVGIGTSTPDQSAKLEVVATDQGVLFPRVDLATASFPSGPAEGLPF
jgi:hypothetical protein